MLLMKDRFELKRILEEEKLTDRERNYIKAALRSKVLNNEHLFHDVIRRGEE